MSTDRTLATSACSPTSSPERYRWFVRLCIAAIALVVLPAALLHALAFVTGGLSNAGALTFIPLAASFVVWQAAMVFLCMSGREIVARRAKGVALLNALYIGATTAAISLFYLFAAQLS
jgi:hypothetical protein